jgi:hypothetical protein
MNKKLEKEKKRLIKIIHDSSTRNPVKLILFINLTSTFSTTEFITGWLPNNVN